MIEFIENSVFFGAFVSLGAYEIGLIMKRKFRLAIFNPLLIAIFCVMGILMVLGVDYESYEEGGKYISYLLTPATVCLAVPLYQQLHLLKKNIKAIAAGIVSGVLASLVSVLLLAKMFGLSHEQYVTLLPKSITTAIGMGVSEELGGIVTITVAVIIITGVLGNVIADIVYKIAKIEEPVAKGLALGTAAHAIGTAKAMIRVSTDGQNISRQLKSMLEIGIKRKNIFIDYASGKDFNRHDYIKVKRKLKKGDVIYFHELDRLGRDYYEIIDEWRDITRNIQADIIIIDVDILNTTYAKDILGTLISDIVLYVLSYTAEKERRMNKKRQREGIDIALVNGVKFGRKQALLPENFEEIIHLQNQGYITVKEALDVLKMKRTTYYKYKKRII